MKNKLKMVGFSADWNTTDRVLTLTDVSLQGVLKTRIIEFNDYNQISKETRDNNIITYEYDENHKLTRAIKSNHGRTTCIVTYTYENDCIVKTYRYDRRTHIQKADLNMNIIFESISYSDGSESIDKYQYNDNECVISNETIHKNKGIILHHSISYYDDTGKLIKTDDISIKE